jgi:hypothetical protein
VDWTLACCAGWLELDLTEWLGFHKKINHFYGFSPLIFFLRKEEEGKVCCAFA